MTAAAEVTNDWTFAVETHRGAGAAVHDTPMARPRGCASRAEL